MEEETTGQKYNVHICYAGRPGHKYNGLPYSIRATIKKKEEDRRNHRAKI